MSRGRLSKPIAGAHLLSGWIRGRSSRVQAAAINELMTKAMDDRQLANIVSNEVGGYGEDEQAFDTYMGAE